MHFRSILAACALIVAGLLIPSTATAAPVGIRGFRSQPIAAKHACTKTSSGKCIKGGQFCPKAKRGKFGWDAQGKKWKCKKTSESKSSNWKTPDPRPHFRWLFSMGARDLGPPLRPVQALHASFGVKDEVETMRGRER